MADFKAGDKVKYRDMVMPAEVLSGPHKTPGNPRYLVRKADGNVTLAYLSEFERIVPRLDRIAGTLAMTLYGLPYTALNPRDQLRVATVSSRLLAIADETKGQA